MRHSNQTHPGDVPHKTLVGTPSWITPELVASTLGVWQPHYDAPLTEQDAFEILIQVGRLFDVLEVSSDEAIRRPGSGIEP